MADGKSLNFVIVPSFRVSFPHTNKKYSYPITKIRKRNEMTKNNNEHEYPKINEIISEMKAIANSQEVEIKIT